MINFLNIRSKIPSLFIMCIRALIIVTKFAVTVFIARYMGFEELGTYGLLVSVTVLAPILFRAGIQNVLTREAVTQTKESLASNLFHYYLAVAAIYSLVFLGLLVTFSFTGFIPLYVFVLMLIMFEHIIVDWFFILLALRKPFLANIMLFVQASGWIIPFIVLAFVFPDLRTIETLLIFWISGGLLAILLTMKFWMDFPWRGVIANGIDKAWYREYFIKSRLFFISDAANAGSVHLDRFVITFLLGLELTGVYVLFWQMANALHTLISIGILQLQKPSLIKAHADKKFVLFKNLYEKSIKDVLLASAGLSFGVVLIAPIITHITDKPLATQYLPLLWAMLVCMVFRALADAGGVGLLACYKDKIFIFSNVINLVASTTMMVGGIILFGVYGATFALIMSYLCLFSYRHNILRVHNNNQAV